MDIQTMVLSSLGLRKAFLALQGLFILRYVHR